MANVHTAFSVNSISQRDSPLEKCMKSKKKLSPPSWPSYGGFTNATGETIGEKGKI